MNLKDVLETMKTTNNLESKVKMLMLLGTTFRSQFVESDITRCNSIYETANSILCQSEPNIRNRILDILASLVRSAPEGAARRARDLLRHSGCLDTMAKLFLGTKTLDEEWWSTLCDCLAESLKDSEENQNDCSHLILKCIKLLSEVWNLGVLKVLHNLLLHHNHNVKLFVKNNGMSIFTRASIQEDYTMQILSIVSQNPKAANLLARDADLMQFLLTVEDKHDRSPKMVEWASIILYHMASHTAGYDSINNREKAFTFENLNKIQSNIDVFEKTSTDLSVSFLFKPNWDNKIPNVFRDLENGTVNDRRESFFLQWTKSARNGNLISESSSDSRKSFRSSTFFDFTSENKFNPHFMPTPKDKHIIARERNTYDFSSLQPSIRVEKAASVFKPKERVSSLGKEHKLSLSARVFHTINDSCESIFKTFGNKLFGNNNDSDKDILESNIKFGEKVPSYSFTKHMMLRNVLREKGICGRNEAFQRKFDFKDHQKQIVKKLKTGIYLYGCNFKKISLNMWPNEKQMTPKVLYDIYRKCIAK